MCSRPFFSCYFVWECAVQFLIHTCYCPGGKEGVLVVWQLETGKKKFLPRIGSPLLYFTDSPDPTLSSVRTFLSI